MYKIKIIEKKRFIGIPYCSKTYSPERMYKTYGECIDTFIHYRKIYDIPNAVCYIRKDISSMDTLHNILDGEISDLIKIKVV